MPYIGNITQDFNVSNAMLDTDSVTSIKIVDGTIEGADIAANLDLSDSQKIRFGTGNDLQIYHNSNHSFIADTGTGDIRIGADTNITLENSAFNEYKAKFITDGAVELYYDNTKRLETDASGVKLSNGRFYSAGTFAFIESSDTSTATLTLKKSASGADSIDYLQLRDSSNNIKLVISGSGDIDIEDNSKLKLGTGDDLQIYHDGSNSRIENSTGSLVLNSRVLIKTANNSESIATFNENGAVELYYDNSKKFETTSAGAHVLGTFEGDNFKVSNPGNNAVLIQNPANGIIGFGANNQSNQVIITTDGHLGIPTDTGRLRFGAAEDLQIYHDGSNSYINDLGTGNLLLVSNGAEVQLLGAGGGDFMVKAVSNGAVELYHDNSKKFETLSSGVKIIGLNATGSSVLGDFRFKDQDDNLDVHYDAENNKIVFHDNNKATFGTADDLEIYHDASNSYIVDQGTGSLIIQGSQTLIRNTSGHTQIKAQNDLVEIYYDNAKKFETESAGTRTTGRHLIKGNSDIDNQFNPLLFLQDSTNTNTKAVFLLEDDYTTGRGALAINVGESGVTNDRDLLLQRAGGKVGVRCTPTESFEVSGTSKFNGAVKLGDSNTLKLGTGEDLEIYHDGSNSFIKDTGTGSLILDGNDIIRLRLNGTTKFQTDSSGVIASGTEHKFTSGTSGDCKLIIEADTDNNEEDDNPLLIFRQDGGLDLSVIGTGLTGSSSDNHLTVANSAANGGISFRTGTANGYTNAVERMRVLAQGGLTFNGDTSNNNALSDYEQGTWTATAEFNTGGFKSCSNNVCRYVKVGTLVHISGRFSLNNHTGASSGELRIEGLPFSKGNPSGDGNSDGIQIYVEGAATNITNGISGLVLDNTTRFLIRRSGTTASGNDMAGKTDSGTTLLVGGTYTTFG